MSKKYFLELPPLHTELADQDKAEFKNQVQWRYEQDSHGRFLERDRVVRSATRDAEDVPESYGKLFLGVFLIVGALVTWFLLGYALVG